MKFPVTKATAKDIGAVLSIIAMSVVTIGGLLGFLTLLAESAKVGRERAYQNGLENGMIECRLRPNECDARYKAWEAQEALEKLLEKSD